MKKQVLRSFLIFGVLAIFAVSPSQAQTGSGQTADIPFEFSVGDRTFPAGHYSVSRLNPQSDKAVLAIKSRDGRMSKIVLTTPIEGARAPETAKLVFSRYDDQYFLTEVWAPADSTGRGLQKSRSERTLARHAGDKTVERVTIALKTRGR